MSRPTNARAPPRRPRGRISVSARTSVCASTGSDLPFASTSNAGPSSNAPRTASAVRAPTTIAPGSLACSSRAATLTASPVTNELPSRARPDDDLARVDADPEREHAVEVGSEPALHRKCRMQRPLGVVLVRLGGAEDRHHRVARELLDRAAGAADLVRHRVVEPLQQRPRALRVLLLAERRRADEVGEEHGGQLPLGGLHAPILTGAAPRF